jgi:hypothetical protein
MAEPPPASEKMEYETAENASHSQAPDAGECDVTNVSSITCDAPCTSDSAPESNAIPRNILGGTGVSPVSLLQAVGGSIASGGMADGSKVDGGLASHSALPHQSAEDTGRMAEPPNGFVGFATFSEGICEMD